MAIDDILGEFLKSRANIENQHAQALVDLSNQFEYNLSNWTENNNQKSEINDSPP